MNKITIIYMQTYNVRIFRCNSCFTVLLIIIKLLSILAWVSTADRMKKEECEYELNAIAVNSWQTDEINMKYLNKRC